MEPMYNANLIEYKWHFIINTTNELKTTTGTRNFPKPTNVLKLKFNAIYSEYAQDCRKGGKKPIASDSLRFYLLNHKHFLGVQKSVKYSQPRRNAEGAIRTHTQTTSAFCFNYDLLKENMNLTREEYNPNTEKSIPNNVNDISEPDIDKEKTLTVEELGF